MKKMLNFVLMMLVMMFVLVSGIFTVEATTVASSLTFTSKEINTPLTFTGPFHVIKVNGKSTYVYCTNYIKSTPISSIKYTKGSEVTDAGVNYILEKGYANDSDNDYFITQVALWIHLMNNGKMSSEKVTDLKELIYSEKYNDNKTAKAIRELVAGAKSAKLSSDDVTLSLGASKLTFTLSEDGKTYVSNVVKVSASGDYSVSLNNSNAVYKKVDGGFKVTIPVKNVSATTTIKATVKTSKDFYKVYSYNPSNSNYQVIDYIYKDSASKSDDVSGTIKITKTYSVNISKVEVTGGPEIEGAKLVLKDEKGNVVDEWKSKTTTHVVSGLTEGTYYLTETLAPDGYVKSDETIKFTIDKNGNVYNADGKKVDKIEMVNERKKYSVNISKVAVTGGPEIEGAQLVLKDEKGKVVDEWESKTTTHVIENLEEGTYYLTETLAPEGYVKSDETIKFTIDKNGNVYNASGEAVSKIEMVNELAKFSVGIGKVSSVDNSMFLEKAKLCVSSEVEGFETQCFTTTTSLYTITDLLPGKYYITEEEAPEGYIMSSEKITFTIGSDGTLYDKDGSEVDSILVENTPESKDEVYVPDTASFKSIVPYVFGIISIAGGAFLVAKYSKKTNE